MITVESGAEGGITVNFPCFDKNSEAITVFWRKFRIRTVNAEKKRSFCWDFTVEFELMDSIPVKHENEKEKRGNITVIILEWKKVTVK